ncbi:MAG: NAD(+) synthase [Spongiibacteraceae bacterium]
MTKTSADAFFNLYQQGFARIAAAVPRCHIADPMANAEAIVALAGTAAAQGAAIVVFPELGLTAYTCDDLFHQQALLDTTLAALKRIVTASEKLSAALVVGLPLRVEQRLFNCAAVIAKGRIRGIVPKSYLPNYAEFYESRQFNPAAQAAVDNIMLLGESVPFGAELLFEIETIPLGKFHVEICEDLWVPIPPSSFAALAGATLLVNLSASNVVIGKAGYRRQLVSQQSARCLAAYLYASAGGGESTTDMAWDGQSLICENGELLAESERFSDDAHVIYADVDLQKLAHERMRTTTFGASVQRHADDVKKFRTIRFDIDLPNKKTLPLQRALERFPYVPSNREQRDARCSEVYHIQVQALAQRLSATGMQRVVIGVSGGLDSTHALLVCAQAMDRLQLPRANIIAVTMPGFATSDRTLVQARQLMQIVGCSAHEIDIRPSCLQMLKDIGHPYASGEKKYDITFENVQAGERTNHLFRLANLHNGIVIGTGDLSELALGWCTYGVGDHMSHYSVNASVPKTLISHLVRWVAETHQIDAPNGIGSSGSDVLLAVLDTDISPELVPGDVNDKPEQKTENVIGPYELHDFFLYYTLRFGFSPSKVAFLAHSAWSDKNSGRWPEEDYVLRSEYDLAAIKKHLRTFLYRFFKTSQFKRSCVPNAPKVGSGGSLSPRGDWRAPSDADATVWLSEWENIPD